ncbi:hypothetical protein [Akkermansia muciniphila]|uniref:hypothetical protein n=1 Tax=Akkermansia muciniphila TaxID=239935 RepID=UPI002044CFA3|nr:hypothetical protein [Akkermansia muciniphila]
MREDFSFVEASSFPGDSPGDGQTLAVMKKIFRYLGILGCLSLHAAAWGDTADNGVECSVVMEKTLFDAREAFPDFKLVFTNKGEKTVRLFDDFYPIKGYGPNIHIEIWQKEGGKRFGKRVGKTENPIAWYGAGYQIERAADSIRFITLKPGEKHEVPIKDAYLLLVYFEHLRNGKRYELEVSFRDGWAEPGVRRKYVGRSDFNTMCRSPKGAFPG